MKAIYLREIKRIIANYSFRKNATGYNIDSKSIISKVIHDLIALKWIDSKYFNGRFLYVIPSDSLKTAMNRGEVENKISAIRILNGNLIENNHNWNLRFISTGIIAA